MMTKEEILNLISLGEMLKAFQGVNDSLIIEKDKIIPFNVLMQEYVNRPNNYEESNYRTRLSIFVNFLEEKVKKVAVEKPADELYDLLCTVNFDTQTTYFRNIHRNKNVSAFLLYGEDPDDLKWLYHQLLHLEGLVQAKPVSIDYTGNVNTSFEQLSQLLYDKFEIKDKDLVSLRFQIELYLQTSPLVIIIKYPGKKLVELEQFYKSFYDFFSLLHAQVAKGKKPVIFLFVEDGLSEYTSLNKNYFLWVNDLLPQEEYSQKAIGELAPKIMDLAPIEKLDTQTVTKWINQRLYNQKILAISCDPAKCLALLEDGNNPYKVISKLYNTLKNDSTQTPDQWLTH